MPDLTSNLGVPARQQFRLGGGQPNEFFAEVQNQGTAMPGEKLRHRFAPGEGAIIVNRSDADASLKVRVWGDTQIAMRYTPAN